MAQMTVSQVASKFGLTSETIHRARRDGLPSWMTQTGKRYFVDVEDPDFKIWLKSKKQKSIQQKLSIQKEKALGAISPRRKSPRAKKKTTPKVSREGDDEVLSDEETLRLQRISIQADLSGPIVKLELDRYKIENERLKIKKLAGELIEFDLAEFLFLGYLDRMNVEKLMFAKKIAKKIEQLVFEEVIQRVPIEDLPSEQREEISKLLATLSTREIGKKIGELIIREEEEIIRSVKEAQAKEVQEWLEERSK